MHCQLGTGFAQVKDTERQKKGMAAGQAYAKLREAIISRLPPGSPLDEEVFAELGLSRTPAREAVGRLAGERLVELLPNRGARVMPMGWNEVREHLEALDVVQRLVCRWAAIRRTDKDLAAIDVERLAFEKAVHQSDGVERTEANWRFHVRIGASCKNTIFDRTNRQILTESLRIDRHAMFGDFYRSNAAMAEHLDRIVADHRAIVEAIRDRDPDRAEQAGADHTALARKRIGDLITRSSTDEMSISVAISE